MLYDKLLKLAERTQLEGAPVEKHTLNEWLRVTLPNARLFEFRNQATIICACEKYSVDSRSKEPLPGMPFPVIAIEDEAQCTVVKADEREGRNGWYNCVVTFPMRAGEGQAQMVGLTPEFLKLPIMGYCTIFAQANPEENEIFHLGAVGTAVERGRFKEEYFILQEHLESQEMDAMREVARHSISVAFCAIRLCMLPKLWVVEKKPTKVRKHNAKRAARSHHRPRYTLMTISQIAKVVKNKKLRDEAKKGTRSSHFRRGHMRTFHSERFKFMQGKSIYIEPQWIGPKEGTNGKYKYRVLTDK